MLTINEVCERLQLGRSTVLRMLAAGDLRGEKRHACGSLCSAPTSCKQGTWRIPESALQPSETGL